MKALKTPEEIELISEAMLKDGVALVRFFAWLDRNLGKEEMTEQSLADKLLYSENLFRDTFLLASKRFLRSDQTPHSPIPTGENRRRPNQGERIPSH